MLGAALLGLVGGFVLGIVVSEAIAISALMMFGGIEELRVLRFLPGVLAFVGFIGAPLLVMRTRKADAHRVSGETPGR
ncbi:hypothetical protein CDO52_26550 [Nocardiopsis gilva YIM 90087]|uniref:ABC3 transporter permease protein domain-containing protein n=1 Tax=Nocardiopsis gilva YIM 90087 TaxID=1235441 RepID=A0A223SCS4_9ACTN|nr:hypothetical protein CDO52_26550 [Nocardiopsis gilva YIM 90087]